VTSRRSSSPPRSRGGRRRPRARAGPVRGQRQRPGCGRRRSAARCDRRLDLGGGPPAGRHGRAPRAVRPERRARAARRRGAGRARAAGSRRRGTGPPRRKPWTRSHPRDPSRESCSAVSTPSATTCRPRAWAIRDDGGYELGVAVVLADPGDEGPVDLQEVDRHGAAGTRARSSPCRSRRRRWSRRDRRAPAGPSRPGPRPRAARPPVISRQRRSGRDAGPVNQPFHLRGQIGVDELSGRHVHAHADLLPARP